MEAKCYLKNIYMYHTTTRTGSETVATATIAVWAGWGQSNHMPYYKARKPLFASTCIQFTYMECIRCFRLSPFLTSAYFKNKKPQKLVDKVGFICKQNIWYKSMEIKVKPPWFCKYVFNCIYFCLQQPLSTTTATVHQILHITALSLPPKGIHLCITTFTFPISFPTPRCLTRPATTLNIYNCWHWGKRNSRRSTFKCANMWFTR